MEMEAVVEVDDRQIKQTTEGVGLEDDLYVWRQGMRWEQIMKL